MTLGEGLADDFFGTAESIGRSSIDEIDTVLDRRSDRGNGLRLLGSTPHPAADGPGAQGNTRHFKRCADNGGTLHLDLTGFGFSSHGLAPSSPRAARERDEVSGWHLDAAAKAEIDRILSATISEPVGPEFMAPPARSIAA